MEWEMNTKARYYSDVHDANELAIDGEGMDLPPSRLPRRRPRNHWWIWLSTR
jgi:hypothetical protein